MSRDQDDYLPLLTPGSQLDLGKGDPVDRSKLNLTWPSINLYYATDYDKYRRDGKVANLDGG